MTTPICVALKEVQTQHFLCSKWNRPLVRLMERNTIFSLKKRQCIFKSKTFFPKLAQGMLKCLLTQELRRILSIFLSWKQGEEDPEENRNKEEKPDPGIPVRKVGRPGRKRKQPVVSGSHCMSTVARSVTQGVDGKLLWLRLLNRRTRSGRVGSNSHCFLSKAGVSRVSNF